MEKTLYGSWNQRKILAQYTEKAGIEHSYHHKLRHFLFTWMKKQGVDDALFTTLLWS